MVIAYDGGLVLFSPRGGERKSPRVSIYDAATGVESVLDGLRFFWDWPGSGWAPDGVVGGYDRGLIGVINAPPGLKDLASRTGAVPLSMSETDNPMLVLIGLRGPGQISNDKPSTQRKAAQ
jgi:hypothetical protein